MVIAFDIETTGLNPHERKVTLVGMKTGGEIRQWKLWEIGDEAKMILTAIEELLRTNETIIGYNNLKFDVPFVIERLKVLGVYRPEFWGIYSKSWFDLYQYLGNDYRSLASWLQRASIERKYADLKGRDMPTFFESKDYDKIVNHNLDDLNTSEELFRFLKKTNPDFIPFD
jgi:uncharacterized protein YprB with RNaseH-like and TPR domain